MNTDQLQNVRVFFEKTGRAKYISHLDMYRCMQRSMKRSGIPIWYTQGFNPHIYLTFTLALSLGYESLCESMDFKLIEPMEFETIKNLMNHNLPSGICIVKVGEPIQKPEAIATADYEIMVIFEQAISKLELNKLFDAFMQQESIEVSKRAKKSGKKIEKIVDIKPLFSIKAYSCEDSKIIINSNCLAGIQLGINPSLVIGAFSTFAQLSTKQISVVRIGIFDEQGMAFA